MNLALFTKKKNVLNSNTVLIIIPNRSIAGNCLNFLDEKQEILVGLFCLLKRIFFFANHCFWSSITVQAGPST